MAIAPDQLLSRLRISENDFDQIRQNLRGFLEAQTELRDFNFDSSAISVILDTLSYNTFYNSFYVNQLAGESFIQTAQKRENLVSLARNFGYIPKSITAPVARISIQVIPTPGENPSVINLPEGTAFTADVGGDTFIYRNRETVTFEPDAQGRYISEFNIAQGTVVTQTFTVDTNNANQRFLLQNANIDAATISVQVQPSAALADSTIYQIAGNVVNINSTSTIYFLEEVENGQYELKFGDGTVGVALQQNNVVTVSYLVTRGPVSNGAQVFRNSDSIGGYNNVVITTLARASGGKASESLDEIRTNLPRSFEAQNRLVTINDYLAFIQSVVPNLDSISGWGGETNDPPTYGDVYISIKPTGKDVYSASEKISIVNSIKSRNVVTVRPVIVDPDYTFLELYVTIIYNDRQTTLSSTDLITSVTDGILTYNSDNLQTFGSSYRISDIYNLVLPISTAFRSMTITTKMQKSVPLTASGVISSTLRFNNPINHPNDGFLDAINSTEFSHRNASGFVVSNCRLDDFNGVLRVIRISDGIRTVVSSRVGTVDYNKGIVVLETLTPTSIASSAITVSVIPTNQDIIPVREQILSILRNNISITLTVGI